MITTTTIMLAALTVDAQTQNVRKSRNIFGFLDPLNLLGTKNCPHSSTSKLVELPGKGCYCNKSSFKCQYGDLCYKDKGCRSCRNSPGCSPLSAEKGKSCKVSAECKGSLYCDVDDKTCKEHGVQENLSRPQSKNVKCKVPNNKNPTKRQCNKTKDEDKCTPGYTYSGVTKKQSGKWVFVCTKNKI